MVKMLRDWHDASVKVQEQITKLVEDMKPKGNREGWVAWMGATCQDIPDECWQGFQQESFALIQRFLQKQPTKRNQPGTSAQQVSTASQVPLVQQQVRQQPLHITGIYSISTGQQTSSRSRIKSCRVNSNSHPSTYQSSTTHSW